MKRITSIMVVWANGARSNHTIDQMVEDCTAFKKELLEQTPGAVRIHFTYEEEEPDNGEDTNRV